MPRTNRRVLAVLIAAAVLGVACSGADDPVVGGGGRAAQGGDGKGNGEAPAGAPLLPSSPTELPTFDLARFQELLGQLEGIPVVVNVWASWCGPCVVEAPELAQVAREFQGDAQFLGVDILDQRTTARAFVRRFGWPYPSVFDPTGGIRDGLGFVGQPVTVVFDRRGRSVFVWSGPITKDLLETELSKVV